MKTPCIFLLSMFIFIFSVAHASPQLSHWNSNFNKIHFTKEGNNISGSYEYAGGKITGVMNGKILRGWWSETDDALMCGPDNKWSGPVVMTFSDDGKSFSGQYGKCSSGQIDFKSVSGDWHGSLLSGPPIISSTTIASTSIPLTTNPLTTIPLTTKAPTVSAAPATKNITSANNDSAGFSQRKGPFSSSEQVVGDFSADLTTTKGIVVVNSGGRATASGTMSPGDTDVVLFGHAADGTVSVSLYPCSNQARLRLLDKMGNELAATTQVSNGYSGLFSSVEVANLPRGAYAVEVSQTGTKVCKNNSWYISVSARIIDPKEFVGPKEKKDDFSTREDINVDQLLNDLKLIMTNKI